MKIRTLPLESEDDLVDRVYLYLKDNVHPKQSSVSLKRQIRFRSKKLELRSGELYYRQRQNVRLVA